MLIDLLLIVLLGALMELERTSVFQGFLSEPIVTAPLAGWVTGDLMLGVKIGILLELFFLGGISIGGSSPLDGTLSAVVTFASVGIAKIMIEKDSFSEGALIALAVTILMIPASRVGRAVDDWIKEMNVNTAHRVDCEIREKGKKAVERTIYKSLGISFVIWGLTTLATTVAGTALLWGAVKIMPGWVSKGMEGVSKFLPFIAGGIALSALRIRQAEWWFTGIFLGLFFILMGLNGFGK